MVQSALLHRALEWNASQVEVSKRAEWNAVDQAAMQAQSHDLGRGNDTPLVAKLFFQGSARCVPRACRGLCLMTACWATKPMKASIARRPFLSSLSLFSSRISAFLLRPRGSKAPPAIRHQAWIVHIECLNIWPLDICKRCAA